MIHSVERDSKGKALATYQLAKELSFWNISIYSNYKTPADKIVQYLQSLEAEKTILERVKMAMSNYANLTGMGKSEKHFGEVFRNSRHTIVSLQIQDSKPLLRQSNFMKHIRSLLRGLFS